MAGFRHVVFFGLCSFLGGCKTVTCFCSHPYQGLIVFRFGPLLWQWHGTRRQIEPKTKTPQLAPALWTPLASPRRAFGTSWRPCLTWALHPRRQGSTGDGLLLLSRHYPLVPFLFFWVRVPLKTQPTKKGCPFLCFLFHFVFG